MTDILQETQDSEKENKINILLSRAAMTVFLVGCIVVSYLGFDSWKINKNNEKIQEDGVILTQTINRINYNKPKDHTESEKKRIADINQLQLEKLEQLAEAQSSGYSALANIYLASLALIDGNSSKALYYYQRIAKSNQFTQVLREYASLVEINTNLQFNKGIYDRPMEQIKEYFNLDNKGVIDRELLTNRYFSNAMALTGIAIENEAGKNIHSNVYLETLQAYEGDNDNVHFIIDMLSQYMKQTNNAAQ
jgi:hypothetical protein